MGVSSCCLPPWWSARQRLLPSAERLNNAHRPAAIGALFSECERNDLGGWRVFLFGRFGPEQGSDLCDVGLAASTGKQAIVADTMKTSGQNVDQEAADELVGGQAHCLLAITVLDPVIFPTERNGLSIGANQAAVGDRNAVRISAEIGEDGFWTTERRLGINHPLRFA